MTIKCAKRFIFAFALCFYASQLALAADFGETKQKWYQDKIAHLGDQEINNFEHLKALEWLIGDWIAESPMGKLDSSYTWAPNHNHIIFTYKASNSDGIQLFEGIEVIYWSSLKNGIFSWNINSQGGESPEEHWTQEAGDGETWKLASDDDQPFVIYTRQNADSFLWEQKKRNADGEVLTTFGPFDNRRVK